MDLDEGTKKIILDFIATDGFKVLKPLMRETAIEAIKDAKGLPIIFFASEVCPTLRQDILENLCLLLQKPIKASEYISDVFADKERRLRLEKNVRNGFIYIVQSTNAPDSNLFEALMFIRTAKTSSAERVTFVVPYYGYARQDQKTKGRDLITAKLVSDLIETAGAYRTVCVDIHAGQIQGYFNGIMDHLTASKLFAQYIQEMVKKNGWEDKKIVVISPDAGGKNRAKALADYLNVKFIIANKNRKTIGTDELSSLTMNTDESLEDTIAIVIDDIFSTGSSLNLVTSNIKEEKPFKIISCITHSLFCEGSLEILKQSPIDYFVTTNSTVFPKIVKEKNPELPIEIISLGSLIAAAIVNTYFGFSITELFSQSLPLRIYKSFMTEDQKSNLFKLAELNLSEGDALQANKQIEMLKYTFLTDSEKVRYDLLKTKIIS